MTIDNITAVILAGGKSSRMGEEKALLKIKDHTFIELIFSTLSKIFKNIIISSDETGKYGFLNCEVIRDIFPDSGPLSGIYSSLIYTKTDYIFLTSCDMPMINDELISFILKNAHNGIINIGKNKNDFFPLLGIYPKSLSSDLEYFLNNNGKRVRDFLNNSQIGYNTIDLSGFNPFLVNINTHSDYEKMIKIVNNR
jgi:molybdenum cofactor guanylyltransferase